MSAIMQIVVVTFCWILINWSSLVRSCSEIITFSFILETLRFRMINRTDIFWMQLSNFCWSSWLIKPLLIVSANRAPNFGRTTTLCAKEFACKSVSDSISIGSHPNSKCQHRSGFRTHHCSEHYVCSLTTPEAYTLGFSKCHEYDNCPLSWTWLTFSAFGIGALFRDYSFRHLGWRRPSKYRLP